MTGDLTPGRRREDLTWEPTPHHSLPDDPEPGDYWRMLKDGVATWYGIAPAPGMPLANLTAHSVTEHEDGTITVSPSILITGHHGREWHGFLERGVWRED